MRTITRLFLLPLLLLVLNACDNASNQAPQQQAPAPASAPVAVSGPSIETISIEQNPNPTVPLAAVLHITTDTATRITINLDDGDRSWSVTPNDSYAMDQTIPVIGMKAGRSHSITATAETEDGQSTQSEALTYSTPELPEEFPRPLVVARQTEKMEPGVILFNVNGRWGPDGKQSATPFAPAVIVDNQGETLWYYLPTEHKVHDIRRLNNGNFLYEIWPGTGGMVEIDVLGNVINRWHFARTAKDPAPGSIPIDHDSLHHEATELPNGNLLVMSTEHRVIENWYTSATDPDAPRQSANVIGDVIIEVNWEGEVLREWKIFDLVDPYRISYRSLREDYWVNHYGHIVNDVVYDWTHGNAVIYEEEDNSFVMSVPYQNAVIKVSMDTGELVWILGDPKNWNSPWKEKLLTPVGKVEWSYLHHAVTHTGDGTYLLFDNGVGRAMPYDPLMGLAESYSRAVEYKVDEENMTVSQPWVYGPEQEHFYARYLGDVDWQPTTGNVQITIGAQETDAEGNNVPPGQAQRWARLVEVTRSEPIEKVWELRFKDEGLGWSIYRSERLPSIYP
jgi:hypothetical protein